MSLSDFFALHDLAVEAGVIHPVIFSAEDLPSFSVTVPRNGADEAAAFYAFARSTGCTELAAKRAYRMLLEFNR